MEAALSTRTRLTQFSRLLSSSLAFNMLERWEQILLRKRSPSIIPQAQSWIATSATIPVQWLTPVSITFLTTFLFWYSVYNYTPGHIAYLCRRFAYYVYGDETVDLNVVFREWVSRVLQSARGLVSSSEAKLEL